MSDPPYYTACPNPWVVDFIAEWEAQKPEQPEGYHYHREPFAADVSEGKNDPIYNAHSYHTKVPHKAIMRYILHYTEPGDIVFDGFCGTGMTGVAAQMCGDREAVMSLGYQVKPCGHYSGPLSQDTNFPNLRYSLLCVAYCFNPAYSVAARGGPVVKRWTTSLFVHRLTTGPQVSRRPAGRGHKYTGCPSSHQFQRWDTVVHFCWRHPMETLVRPLVVVEVEIALQ